METIKRKRDRPAHYKISEESKQKIREKKLGSTQQQIKKGDLIMKQTEEVSNSITPLRNIGGGLIKVIKDVEGIDDGFIDASSKIAKWLDCKYNKSNKEE